MISEEPKYAVYNVFPICLQHWECKLLFTMFMYSVSACNVWIFVEALYLTMLVYRPLNTEKNGVRAFVVLGWGTCI